MTFLLFFSDKSRESLSSHELFGGRFPLPYSLSFIASVPGTENCAEYCHTPSARGCAQGPSSHSQHLREPLSGSPN